MGQEYRLSVVVNEFIRGSLTIITPLGEDGKRRWARGSRPRASERGTRDEESFPGFSEGQAQADFRGWAMG